LETFNWQPILFYIVGMVIGLFGGWVFAGLELIVKENRWTWVPFEPRYAADLALGLLGTALSLVAVARSRTEFFSLAWDAALGAGIVGKYASGVVLKPLRALWKRRNGI
jgi:hypothetical protein